MFGGRVFLRVGFRFHHCAPPLKISDRVRTALHEDRPVVALESTVITHGLPYPTNLETARTLEDVVISEGGEPATIALLDGYVHVGLEGKELQRVAEAKEVKKVSTRDLPLALSKKFVGGTTVAATMFSAHLAGIRVFATGGIGGVHRGAESTWDVSADLVQLSRTPVAVVCAGIKSILDIPKTIEYLETLGVNVAVYNSTNVFPSFFTRISTAKGQFNTTDLQDIVNLMNESTNLGLSAGTIVACPIPEDFEAEGTQIEAAIQEAMSEAMSKNIASQAVTPFLLARVNELTRGASMKTNVALLKNNAKIATRLASEFLKRTTSSVRSPSTQESAKKPPSVVVIGAAIVDFETITHEDVKDDGGSYVGEVAVRCGGVGRNMADALTRLGVDTRLISAVGDDRNGEFLRNKCQHMDLSRVVTIPKVPTATYMSINVKGNVKFGVSSIGRIVDMVTPTLHNVDIIKSASYLVIDGNIPVRTIMKAVDVALDHHVRVWFEPTDIAKMKKLFEANRQSLIDITSPNANEFKQFCELQGIKIPEEHLRSPDHLAAWISAHRQLMLSLSLLLVTLGRHGTVAVRREKSPTEQMSIDCLPAPAPGRVVSVSGAGDCFNAGLIAALLADRPWNSALGVALEAASHSLRSSDAVPNTLNPNLVTRL